jgi:hypothetical protein
LDLSALFGIWLQRPTPLSVESHHFSAKDVVELAYVAADHPRGTFDSRAHDDKIGESW